jgi:N-formylglutamate amidohydrolase
MAKTLPGMNSKIESLATKAGFEILAPVTWSVPVVFNSPHSGRMFPKPFLAASQLSEHDLRRAEDCYVDELFGDCVDQGVPLLRATFARSFLDLNREPNELDQRMYAERLPHHLNNCTSRVTSGLGVIPRMVGEGRLIYPGPISLPEALSRIETWYRPYHRVLSKLLDEAHDAAGTVLLVDCHSMPSSAASTRQAEPELADVILGDRFGAACDGEIMAELERAFRQEGLSVRRNKPYAGGFITEIHGRPSVDRHAVQIELNRELYMDEERLSKNANFGALQQSLSRITRKLLSVVSNHQQMTQALRLAAE